MLEKNKCLILSTHELDILHDFLKTTFIDGIRKSKWECIFINASSEYEVYLPNRIELEQALLNSSTQIHILIGSGGNNNEKNPAGTFVNTVYHHNPLYWLVHVHREVYRRHSEYTNNVIDINPSYLITSLNATPHHHRCLLLDRLHKHNLLNDDNFSWSQLSTKWEMNYKFKYWEEKVNLIDDNFITSGHHYHNIPQSQFESVFNIISESTRDTLFWTEKTFIPISIGKPIIISGAQYINRELTKFGFKLYDGVIDYSKFDDYPEYDDRVNGLCNQLNKLNNSKNFKEILNIIEPTIIHNYNTFQSLFKSYKLQNLPFFKLAHLYGIESDDIIKTGFY